MKCQKCSKPALVHLTEVVSDSAGAKRAVEIHLCLGHAMEAGLVAPGSEMLPQLASGSKKPDAGKGQAGTDSDLPTAIVPSLPEPSGLAVVRESSGVVTCPVCGLTWNDFKQSGLMGCPHDYEMFDSRLLPLLKRAQEGAGEHMGKVPTRKKTEETDRQVTQLRLRRELQKAIDAENYEQAARLRDQLRTLGKN